MGEDELDKVRLRPLLAELPKRLGGALGGDELRAALAGEWAGVTQRFEPSSLLVGARWLPSPLARVVLGLEPPVDVRSLAELWGIEAPVGVSGDVHQQRWHVLVSGRVPPDPTSRRITSVPFAAGRWGIDMVLGERPSGPLPVVMSGASPAYDLMTTGGQVRSLTVERSNASTDVVPFDHAAVAALTRPVRPVESARRRLRRRRTPSSQYVVVRDGNVPLAVAGFRIDREALLAHSFGATPDAARHHAGSALIDALEAIALSEGLALVRLDRSAVAVRSIVPFERHGYQFVGPVNDVSMMLHADDSSAEAVAERRLAARD